MLWLRSSMISLSSWVCWKIIKKNSWQIMKPPKRKVLAPITTVLLWIVRQQADIVARIPLKRVLSSRAEKSVWHTTSILSCVNKDNYADTDRNSDQARGYPFAPHTVETTWQVNKFVSDRELDYMRSTLSSDVIIYRLYGIVARRTTNLHRRLLVTIIPWT